MYWKANLNRLLGQSECIDRKFKTDKYIGESHSNSLCGSRIWWASVCSNIPRVKHWEIVRLCRLPVTPPHSIHHWFSVETLISALILLNSHNGVNLKLTVKCRCTMCWSGFSTNLWAVFCCHLHLLVQRHLLFYRLSETHGKDGGRSELWILTIPKIWADQSNQSLCAVDIHQWTYSACCASLKLQQCLHQNKDR